MTKFKIQNHILVPKHSKLNDKEKKDLLEKYHIALQQLPKILKKDPAIKNLNIKVGDVIKIERKSQTAGISIFYRCVISG